MNNVKMGLFISELRKSHQMTQKELSAKLNVSDKAVSKWERGLSCPDISLLSPISDILGVTTTELLNGERTEAKETLNVDAIVDNALDYGEKTATRKIILTKNIWSAAFTIFLLIGIAIVSVVNVIISKKFTWSLIPISSCIFTWIIFFPLIKYGMKGIIWSLSTFSLFIVPYLFILDRAITRITGYNEPVFSIGIRIAPLSIILIWSVLLLFKKFKNRKLLAIAFSILLAAPINFIINFMISEMQSQSLFGEQIIINTLTLVVVATILFIIELVVRKRM